MIITSKEGGSRTVDPPTKKKAPEKGEKVQDTEEKGGKNK